MRRSPRRRGTGSAPSRRGVAAPAPKVASGTLFPQGWTGRAALRGASVQGGLAARLGGVSTGGRLVDLVQNRIDEFLDARVPILASISDDTAPMGAISRDFLRFGKRFRARFAYWGWQSVQDADDPIDLDDDDRRSDLPAVIGVAAS